MTTRLDLGKGTTADAESPRRDHQPDGEFGTSRTDVKQETVDGNTRISGPVVTRKNASFPARA
jgi:hypothetical protein